MHRHVEGCWGEKWEHGIAGFGGILRVVNFVCIAQVSPKEVKGLVSEQKASALCSTAYVRDLLNATLSLGAETHVGLIVLISWSGDYGPAASQR